MRKPSASLVRIVWRDSILDRTYSEFFALPRGSSIVPRERSPRSLYTIIGRGKQCARPGKRIASPGDSPLPRIMLSTKYAHCTLGYLGEIASRNFIATRLVTRDKSSSSQEKPLSYIVAKSGVSQLPPRLHPILSRTREARGELRPLRSARLTVAISSLGSRQIKLYVIAFFYMLLLRTVTNSTDRYVSKRKMEIFREKM